MGKAAWNIIWFQIILAGVLISILSLLSHVVGSQPSNTIMSSWGFIIIPLVTMVSAGLLYLSTRILRGRGTFLQQCYTTCLYSVPLSILANIFLLIPTTGLFLSAIVDIYVMILGFLMIRAVHHLSLRKAFIVVVVTWVAMVILVVVVVVVVVYLTSQFTIRK